MQIMDTINPWKNDRCDATQFIFWQQQQCLHKWYRNLYINFECAFVRPIGITC